MKLHNAIYNVQDIDQIDDVVKRIVQNNPILINGELETPEHESSATLEVAIGPVAAELPSDVRELVESRYGDGICARDLNLIEAGVLLAVLSLEGWVMLDELTRKTNGR